MININDIIYDLILYNMIIIMRHNHMIKQIWYHLLKNNHPIFFRFSLNEALKWLEKGISDFSFSCVVA